jgi:hypothetical protein
MQDRKEKGMQNGTYPDPGKQAKIPSVENFFSILKKKRD